MDEWETEVESAILGKKKKHGGRAGMLTRNLRQRKEKMERMSSSDEDCVVRNEPAGAFNHLGRKLLYIYCHCIHYVI